MWARYKHLMVAFGHKENLWPTAAKKLPQGMSSCKGPGSMWPWRKKLKNSDQPRVQRAYKQFHTTLGDWKKQTYDSRKKKTEKKAPITMKMLFRKPVETFWQVWPGECWMHSYWRTWNIPYWTEESSMYIISEYILHIWSQSVLKYENML